jgi:uncharacterized protein YceK
MKKLFAIIAVSIILSGCGPSVSHAGDIGLAVGMIDDLKDCKTYKVGDGMKSMYIVRCPNSTTSTLIPGKNPVHTVVIDETSN